jgi:hypothetical protein
MTPRTRAPHITEVAGSVGPSQDIGPSKLEAMTCAPQVSVLAEDRLIVVFPKVARLFDAMAQQRTSTGALILLRRISEHSCLLVQE